MLGSTACFSVKPTMGWNLSRHAVRGFQSGSPKMVAGVQGCLPNCSLAFVNAGIPLTGAYRSLTTSPYQMQKDEAGPLNLYGADDIFTAKEKTYLTAVIDPQIRKDFPYALWGFAHDGEPIWILEYSKWPNVKYVDMGAAALKGCRLHHRQMLTRMKLSPYRFSTPEKQLTRFHFIADVADYPLTAHRHAGAMSKVMQEAKDFQPFMLNYGRSLTIVNVTEGFKLVLNTVQSVLAGEVGENMLMLGDNPKISKRFRKLYPLESLPENIGGTAKKPIEMYN